MSIVHSTLALEKKLPKRSFLFFRWGVAGVILIMSDGQKGSASSFSTPVMEPSYEVGRVSQVSAVESEESERLEEAEVGLRKSHSLGLISAATLVV